MNSPLKSYDVSNSSKGEAWTPWTAPLSPPVSIVMMRANMTLNGAIESVQYVKEKQSHKICTHILQASFTAFFCIVCKCRGIKGLDHDDVIYIEKRIGK